ncbi:transglutaminase-like domain-containing protein [Nocardioides sp.]|uniref:transglutaminase-like domain-containing protein n=1 Tax=Nocardioides sp. TaxID=35761 RepID=UPI002C106CCE|nr:transglutaminase-like domain-containing protein [Nocardioides sp.]HXH80974.1 transglutaminase-like domain-containing protein [Nocardioides sp.]
MSAPKRSRTRPLPPYAGIDLLAISVLTAMAISGFWPAFDGYRWLIVAGAGAAIGAGWALLIITVRLGLDIVLESMAVIYLLTAGAVALGSAGFFLGIPDPDTLNRVLAGTFTSWRTLIETAPPMDGSGTVLLIPYALTYFLCCTATAMALRSRRAVLPLIPLVVMLVMVLVLGFAQPFSTVLQGIGFGAVALLWVGHRGLRIEAGRKADVALGVVPLGRVVSATAVVAVVAAATLPFADSIEPEQRVVLREVVTPYDAAGLQTPLSDFRRFREQGPEVYNNLADTKLFRVRGSEAGTRVRVAVMDRYDGERWYAANDTSESDFSDRFLRVSSRIDNDAAGEEKLYTVFVRAQWDLPWVPTIGAMQAFEFYDDYAQDRLPDLRYNRSTDTAVLPGGLDVREDYVLTAIPVADKLTPRMEPWPRPDETLYDAAAFLDLPAQAWSLDARTPMEGVFKIADRLKERGRYSDGAFGWETKFEAGQDSTRLDEGFINAPATVGNDEQYAAAMALLVNRLGIPARVAVGTVLGDNGVIKGKHFNAWVEVRVSNGSWRVLPTKTFMSNKPPRRDDVKLAPVRMPPERNSPQKPPRERPEEQLPDPPADPQQEPDEPLPTWPLLLLLPASVVLIPAVKTARRRRRQAAWLTAAWIGGWDELLDSARDLGVAVPPRSTRPAQATALGLPTALARDVDVAVFSPTHPPSAETFWTEVETWRESLKSSATPLRRAWALFNPASLLPRRR